MDLHAAVQDSVVIAPTERALIPCGIAIAIPDGYEGQVRSRSGLTIDHGVIVVHSQRPLTPTIGVRSRWRS